MRTIISLCSGIGGLDIAVEKHFDAEVIIHSETNAQASAVMAHHFPNSKAIGDFRDYNPGETEADLLVAGFPCQPVSKANRTVERLGTEHDEWLFPDIEQFILDMKSLPQGLVFENVNTLRSFDNGETFRDIIGSITQMGYRTAWGLLRASDAGNPQRRSRLFILALLPDSDLIRTQKVWEELQLAERRKEKSSQWGDYGAAIERWEQIIGRHHPEPLLKDGTGPDPRFHEWLMGFPDGYCTDIVPAKTNSLRLLGNAVCPQQATLALHLLHKCFQ